MQDEKLGAVESSLQVWKFSFWSVRTEDVIVARRRMGYIRLTLGHWLHGDAMPVLQTMVRRSEYHTFFSNAGRPICTEECCACCMHGAWHDVLSDNRRNISIYVQLGTILFALHHCFK